MHRFALLVWLFSACIGILAAPAAADDKGTCFGYAPWLNYATRPGPDSAIEACDRLLRSGNLPQFIELADVYRARAWAFRENGDRARALADFNEAIRLNPKKSDSYANRGEFWLFSNDFASALADFNEAIRLNPSSLYAYRLRGMAFNGNVDYERAIADLTIVIRKNSETPYACRTMKELQCGNSYKFRAFSYEKKGDLPNALADYRMALGFDPGEKEAAESIKRVEQKLAAIDGP